MRRLNALLRRKPQDLSIDERQTLVTLAEAAGVDLTGVFSSVDGPMSFQEEQRQASTVRSRQPSPVPEPPTACAADEEF